MNKKEYDELMIEALKRFKEEQFSDIPEENEIEYDFSDSFKENMTDLIKDDRNSSEGFLNGVTRKVVAAVLVLIIGISTTVTIKAYKTPIINFYYTYDGEELKFVTPTEPNMCDKIETFYVPPLIPTGYEFKEDMGWLNDNGVAQSFWRDKDTNEVIFSQITGNTAGGAFVSDVSERKINGIGVLWCESSDNYYYCFWIEKGYFFKLAFYKQLGEDYAKTCVGKLISTTPQTNTEK